VTARQRLNLDALPQLADAARAVGVPLDGHSVGMIGEEWAARLLGLTLVTASTEGYDALDSAGRKVEVKSTTRSTVYLGSDIATLLAVVQLDRVTLAATVVYFGPTAPLWAIAGPVQKNGLRAVRITKAAALMRANRFIDENFRLVGPSDPGPERD
jgi:hypothetical protein